MSKEASQNDLSKEKTKGSSRLGKEAKIGVTVIAVLLIVFGVVVAMRVKGSSTNDQLASTSDREGDKDDPGGKGKAGAMLKDIRTKPFARNSATVVAAKAETVKPPITTVGEANRWKLPAGRDESKRKESTAASASPLFMPEPPKHSHAGRYEEFGMIPPVKKDKDIDDEKKPRELEGGARLVAPAGDTSARSGERGAGRTDPFGYSSAEAASPPSSYREHSHYDNPPPQPPASLPTGPNYSDSVGGMERTRPVTAVGDYGSERYRQEPAGGGYNGAGSHRAAVSSYTAAPRRDDGKYEVLPNDSYWTISERLYGTGAYFKALAQHNRGKGTSEDHLQPGELILVPAVAQLEKSYPDLCPKPNHREGLQSQAQSRTSTVSMRNPNRGGRSYTVGEGDTLFSIARYELGKASRWAEIYEINRDVLGKDFNYLTPGTQLALPINEKSDVIARPPGTGYRR